jgi:tetratricopeptide (TPR) repeat protein
VIIPVASAPAEDTITTSLRSAAVSLSAGHLEAAEGELQKVLHASPKEYRALDLLGVVRVLQHHTNDAETLFQQSIESKPDFASAHAHLGLLYLEGGREGDAVPELREAIRLDPSRSDASGALIRVFREQARSASTVGNQQAALGFLIEARRIAPKNADVQFEFAMAALQMSLLQDAADAFAQTLLLRKDDPLAIYGLGRAYGGLGKFEDARKQFTRYIALRPDDPSGYCSLGMTLAALDRRAEAKTQFEKSTALLPSQTESYFQLGILEIHDGDLVAATEHLRRVLDHNADHAGALSALGRIEFEQKHYAQAAELLKRAIADNNSLQEAHYYLALTYARTGRRAESEREFERATELEHEDVEKRRSVWNRLELAPIEP